MSTHDEAIREKALREVLSYLLREEWNKNTPEIGTSVHRIVKRITGNRDPYEKLKSTAAKIAISGNAIDFGPRIEIDIEKEVQDVLEYKLAINDVDQLKGSTLRFKTILYLADKGHSPGCVGLILD